MFSCSLILLIGGTVLNFENLTKSGLSASQKKCAELIVMKDINKMSMTQIAEEIGVNRSTIFRWKQNKEFNDYLNSLADEFQRSFLADAFSTLRTVMVHGRTHEKLKAVELILKNQGKLKDNTEVNATVKQEVSADDFLKQLGL
ncbi:phBC6A51 family helix-turn-helix protein [Clostridium perfringens]|uniref:phBC6A51 family helix-turn-helix protein n=1 Tax=Clostridium perfringens TaxID=1502 RepID=UPI002971DE64|nr:phBC6A51 family helix-turn-helix protein [Clostridium perfringens]MDM0495314.1 phBC6A51 family helix-turn-helix protein [Clostridium perfringens]